MFNPDLRGVLTNHLSRYSLVTATAKRAREIAMTNLQEKNLSTENKLRDLFFLVWTFTYRNHMNIFSLTLTRRVSVGIQEK